MRIKVVIPDALEARVGIQTSMDSRSSPERSSGSVGNDKDPHDKDANRR